MRRPAAWRCNGMNREKFCSRLSNWGTVRSGRAIVLTWTCSSASPAPSLFTSPESALTRLSCEWTGVWTECKKCQPAWDNEHAGESNKTAKCILLIQYVELSTAFPEVYKACFKIWTMECKAVSLPYWNSEKPLKEVMGLHGTFILWSYTNYALLFINKLKKLRGL